MNYKILIYLSLALLASCEHHKAKIIFKKDIKEEKKIEKIKLIDEEKDKKINDNSKLKVFNNKGFVLIYDENLFKKKIVNKKINKDSIYIYNKNLIKNAPVKITNLLNGKSIISKVDNDIEYPFFYNAVISKKIANELSINNIEPYIHIETLNAEDFYVAKTVKTYDEEKNVANKIFVETILIEKIGDDQNFDAKETSKKQKKVVNKIKFNYIIKIADLYFEDSANMLIERLENEFNIKNLHIKKITINNFRVYKGPFSDLDSLKNAYNDIINLNFDNIEIIKL